MAQKVEIFAAMGGDIDLSRLEREIAGAAGQARGGRGVELGARPATRRAKRAQGGA